MSGGRSPKRMEMLRKSDGRRVIHARMKSCGKISRPPRMERYMELSKRMKAVAQMVPAGHITADVGCDHGFVSIYLVKNGVCPHVYAADVRPGPLERAKAHIEESGLSAYITPVLSDGLQKVPDDADVMIAAGMGGKLTIKILSDVPQKTERLSCVVLEPQSEVWLVRRWLLENGFVIADEDMVCEDGKFYPVIKAMKEPGKELAKAPEAAEKGRNTEKVHGAQDEGALLRAKAQIAALQKEMTAAGISEERQRTACDCFGPVLLAKKSPVLLSYLEHTIEKDSALAAQMPEPEEGQEKSERIRERREELKERIALAGQIVNLLKRA